MRGKIINIVVVLFAFLLGGGLMYVVITNPLDSDTENNAGLLGCQYTSCENKVIIDDSGISAAVDKVYDAVVMVKNYQGSQLSSTGSGFVYKIDDKYGYIMTNEHVVSGANELSIVMTNQKEVKATKLGGDEYLDIAVLRIPVSDVLKVASIGSTEDLKLGDTIFTIGSPVGEEYYNTVTSGIISGIDRLVTVSVNSQSDWIMKVSQVDAAINPGNSGGPLMNSNGEVIGVNSMKLVDDSIEGMGFSIKIEDAMAHVNELEQAKEIERPMLGITLLNASDTRVLASYGISIPSNISSGVVVVSVVSGSGASKSGLEKGDVITKIDDEEVINAAYLKYILYKYKVGDKITVTYSRDGKEKTTTVTLSKNTE
ncbi:MAG: trypsin-like peptidase domain-containing protein [Bacilli bacterium]|nr:trypsin-like peptidase domain-containing protein [Bacilli bacterium]